MKPIIISSTSNHVDLQKYGKQSLDQIVNQFHGVVYEQVAPDFSNIPELFDDNEKLVLFYNYVFPDGFVALSRHLPSFRRVKYLLSPYSRYEGLDLDLVKKMGIKYRNNGGANAKSVAQYAIMAMFMLLSKYPVLIQSKETPDGSILGEELAGKSAGVIGMGNVGREILEMLQRLGVETAYFNRSEVTVAARRVGYEEIFQQDLLFISIASSSVTVQLLQQLPALLRDHNYLIDVSAADELYDKKSVVGLLNQDKLKGYALEIDDMQSLMVESKKNLVVTPHIAWCTLDAEKRTVENYLNRALMILQDKAAEIDFIVK